MKIRFLLVLFFLGGGGLLCAADSAPGLAIGDTPPAVQKAIRAQIGKGTITAIDKVSDDDGTSYAVQGKNAAGVEKIFTLGDDGVLQSIEVTLDETPAAVQKTIGEQLGKNQLAGIDKTIDERTVEFAVELTTPEGQDRSLIIAPDGTLESREVGLDEVPAAVQAAIKAQLGSARLDSIDKTFDADEVSYEVMTITRNGQERGFTVDALGHMQSLDLTLAETPAPVQAAIKTQIGAGKLQSIDETFSPEGITFDVEMNTKDGAARHFSVNPAGQLVSVELALSDISPAIQAAITSEAGPARIESIDKNFEPDGITFDITTMGRGGRERDFTISDNGTLLTREVFLENIPPGAQRTIREQIGNGHIIRIDRSAERESGVLPFVVQGRKNGLPFNFSVGPGGRFLGMDN